MHCNSCNSMSNCSSSCCGNNSNSNSNSSSNSNRYVNQETRLINDPCNIVQETIQSNNIHSWTLDPIQNNVPRPCSINNLHSGFNPSLLNNGVNVDVESLLSGRGTLLSNCNTVRPSACNIGTNNCGGYPVLKSCNQ